MIWNNNYKNLDLDIYLKALNFDYPIHVFANVTEINDTTFILNIEVDLEQQDSTVILKITFNTFASNLKFSVF